MMMEDILKRIESLLKDHKFLSDSQKIELADLLLELKQELKGLSEEHLDDAHSIANFVQAITHESLRQTQRPQLIKLSLQGLSSSVREFELTHPGLVSVVNNFCLALSGMGI